MVKIIETNLSMSDMIVMDHQNRVIEVSSWEDYCNAFATKIKLVSKN